MIKRLFQKDGTDSSALRIMIGIILTAAVFAVYWQAQRFDFNNFDDNIYVTLNENIKKGFTGESVVWAFTATHASNWHPVTWLSHMLDYRLFGLNPAGHHLVNVLFHAANSLLLFMILARMTGGIWQSAFVAAMFAIHPLNVESVAWIAERKNVISSFFWFLTMWAYASHAKKAGAGEARGGMYLLTILFFALGLWSKPMLVTLPFVLLMLDYWPLGRLKPWREKDGIDTGEKLSRLIREKIPLLALAAASCAATFAAQKSSVQSAGIFPMGTRIVNAMVSYVEYLGKMVWPKGLNVLYPHPGNALPIWKGALCAAALACVTVLVLRKLRKAPYLAIGWFWYLGTMVPVIGIVQVGSQAMADRYAYIPLIGIFIAIAWGLPDLLKNRRWRNRALAIAAGIIIPVLMTVSWIQAGTWKNSVTLYNHAIEVTGKKYRSFAVVFFNLGIAHRDKKNFKMAIANYKEAIRLNPDYVKAHYNLGNALVKRKDFQDAIAHYRETVRLSPNHPAALNNLGIALSLAGNPDEAIVQFREAIRLAPMYAAALFNLGNTLSLQGNFQEAIVHYEAAIKYDPDLAMAQKSLMEARSRLEKPKDTDNNTNADNGQKVKIQKDN